MISLNKKCQNKFGKKIKKEIFEIGIPSLVYKNFLKKIWTILPQISREITKENFQFQANFLLISLLNIKNNRKQKKNYTHFQIFKLK